MDKKNLTLIILGILNGIVIIVYLIIIFYVDKERKQIEYKKLLENPKVIVTQGFINNINNKYIEVIGNNNDDFKYPSLKIIFEKDTKILQDNKEVTEKIETGQLVEVYLKKQIIKKNSNIGKAYSINIISEKTASYNNFLARSAFYYLNEDIRAKLIPKPSIILLKMNKSYLIKDRDNKETDIKDIEVYKINYKVNDEAITNINVFIDRENKEILGTITELKK